jgi:hypothetical protein
MDGENHWLVHGIPYTLATKNASRRMDSRLLNIAGDDELHVFRHPVRGTNEENGRGALEIIFWTFGGTYAPEKM